jgi:glycosyltransferase involved in cell wall biosynthesis
MRIAILSNAFPPDGRGGAERITALQADVLFERQNEISVWAPESDASRSEEGDSRSDSVHRFSSSFSKLNSMNPFQRLAFHLADRGVNHRVAREILTWKPDVLMTHNVSGCGMGTASYIQARGICWIHTVHDVQLFEPSGKIRSDRNSNIAELCWRACWAALRRLFFGVPNVLVSPSAWLLHMHERYGFRGKKMVILPNPIDVAAEELGHAMHQPSTLAFVGRLSMDKGVDIFADVCRHLIRQGLVNRVLIAGDGPDRHVLPTDPMIDLRGAVSFEEAHAIIAEADLLIAPSRLAENQPTVILEAMAEGTPVIASDTLGARELLTGTNAPLIPWSGDVAETFTKTAISLLSDSKRWHAISHAMHERARVRHDAELYAENLMRLIHGCKS